MTGKPDIQEAADPVRGGGGPPSQPTPGAPEPSFPAGEPEAPVKPTSSGEAESETDHERQLEHDLEELTAKAEKADEYLDLAKRTKADFENYRRRAAREAAVAQERGIAKLAKELLPAVDNLDRALQAAEAATQTQTQTQPHRPGSPRTSSDNGTSTLVSGIKLVHDDVIAALARAGVEGFSPQGERFDPQLHEAIAQQPVEGAEPGTVVEVYQRGYRLGEVVIRPARVVVAA